MQHETSNDEMTSLELSLAERKAIFLMRNMREFEKFEVKKTAEGITIVSTATTKETFHE